MNTGSAHSCILIPAYLLTPILHRLVAPRGDHSDDYLENGRTYHGYRKGLYIAPCDDVRDTTLWIYTHTQTSLTLLVLVGRER